MTFPSRGGENVSPSLGAICAITVTFHPDPEILARQLAALPREMPVLLVDNGSTDAELAAAALAIANHPRAELLRLGSNLGLPAAINRGARHVEASSSPPEFLLLLDQDSEPRPDAVQKLLDGFLTLEGEGERVGGVGPVLIDPATGLAHGFHVMQGLRWRRVFPTPDNAAVRCANLNGSGTLVRLELFRRLGGLDESMFIDHVDTEWSFQVIAAGYGIFGVPDAVFAHAMGAASLRFWCFGDRVWPYRTPARHRFLFRNAVWLMRRGYVPRVWKTWAVAKLLITWLGHLGFDKARFDQTAAMWRGVREGLMKPDTRRIGDG